MVNSDQHKVIVYNNSGLDQESDRYFMERALALAAKGQGYTSPNPAVGAVVVKNGNVVGEGYHRRAGGPHAEVEALLAAGNEALGSTIYVTLEPCNHYGRTPPCTESLIAAGIRRVVYAVGDPNPRVSGSGHRRLEEAGLIVASDVCVDEARQLNRFFFHYITCAMPYVIAKFATSLDGKVATRTGDSRWISGEKSRQHTHFLRHICDAIVIGADTAIADNPRLTTRIDGFPDPRHPIRILLDSRGRVPLDANIFDPALPGRTIIAATDAMPKMHKAGLIKKGMEVLTLPSAPDGRIELPSFLRALGKREITSLLVEGGGQVLSSFISTKLVDEVWAVIAPIIIGGESAPGPVRGLGVEKVAEAFQLQDAFIEKIGSDFVIKGYARHVSGDRHGASPGAQVR
ncbi:MAG: bifunctional diaminohydroxyphosphoribosylaminopyrimidine deaminase/5-amino-6-(5-phosphoribosylamino)uracil reductase RibD [Bellilinea sp.]